MLIFSIILDEVPTLFLLFILSHGEKNGVILTDTKNSDEFESFTTQQVCESLKQNKHLKNCLKVTFFGVIIL